MDDILFNGIQYCMLTLRKKILLVYRRYNLWEGGNIPWVCVGCEGVMSVFVRVCGPGGMFDDGVGRGEVRWLRYNSW